LAGYYTNWTVQARRYVPLVLENFTDPVELGRVLAFGYGERLRSRRRAVSLKTRHRLLQSIWNIPPAEAEERFFTQKAGLDMVECNK
jgi:hypothetical protein